MPKVIDLFCGIGGLSLGFKNNGFEIACANEYDKEISQSFQRYNEKLRYFNAVKY